MSKRFTGTVDWLLLVAGTLIGFGSLTADLLGIGAYPGFGWKQSVGTGVAIVLVALGAGRIVWRERKKPT